VPYLLDTNIAIHVEEGNERVLSRCEEHKRETFLSALSLVELERGIYADPANVGTRKKRLIALLRIAPVLAFDEAAAHAYGRIIAKLGLSKRRDFDRMIAGHALATESVLVTNNAADFSDIPGLNLEDWT